MTIAFVADLTVAAQSPVVLLVHCDGANGSTAFIDKSPSAHPLTPTSVTVATGNPKFGTGSASLTFSNLAASISVGSNASDFWFDSGPFTMEAWCYATQAPGWDGYSILFAEWGGALSNLNFWFSAFPTIMFFWSFDGVNYDYVDAGISCPLNAWTHIAADRDASGTLRVYLNGAVVASRSIPGSFFHSTLTCQVGNDNTFSRPFPGYLDEIRVTKGVAQYGGAFTPPTTAFPDPGAPPPVDLAGNLAISVSLAGDVAPLRDLAGNLTVSVGFAANVADQFNIVGDLAPAIAFVADLDVVLAVRNYVDFTGNLGGVSSYGRGSYGVKHYSRIDAFTPAFAADMDIVGSPYLAGNLTPVVTFAGTVALLPGLTGDLTPGVTFAGDLSFVPYVELAGDLSPQIGFAADTSLLIGLAGDIALQIDLGGLLTGDVQISGDLPFQIDLAASTLISGPLWASSEPCPVPPWTPTAPAPPSLWTPVDPCDVEWEDSELCNG